MDPGLEAIGSLVILGLTELIALKRCVINHNWKMLIFHAELEFWKFILFDLIGGQISGVCCMIISRKYIDKECACASCSVGM